jgi:hypothetical protein
MRLQTVTLLAGSVLLVTGIWLMFPTQPFSQVQGVLGQGNVSCDVWLDSRSGDDVQIAARIAWILGYITAYNQYALKPEGDVSGGRNTQEIVNWIAGYCSEHPSDNLYSASAALIDQYKKAGGR